MYLNPEYRHTTHDNKSESAYLQSLESNIFVIWQINGANSFHRHSPTFEWNYPLLICQNNNRETLLSYQVTYKILNLQAQCSCDFGIAAKKRNDFMRLNKDKRKRSCAAHSVYILHPIETLKWPT